MLSYAWNPVKINPHGTIEYRGFGMNKLSTLFGPSTMFKFTLKNIQQNYQRVIPLDMDLKESFRVENNLLFVPGFSDVTRLQKYAAYEGLKNKEVYNYTKNFFKFARTVTSENYLPLLDPVKNMLESKKTTSDRIMEYFKRKGFKNKITESAAKEGAIKFSNDFKKDLIKIKETIDRIEH